jgi:hypothetical protein
VVGDDDGVEGGTLVDELDDGLDDELAVTGSLPSAFLPALLVQPATAASATRVTSAGCLRITPVCAAHLGSVS